jgi:hypothetical protein
MSFWLSFHQALLGPTGPHQLDDPSDLSCKDRALIAQFQAQPPAALQHNGRRPATTAEGSPEAGS